MFYGQEPSRHMVKKENLKMRAQKIIRNQKLTFVKVWIMCLIVATLKWEVWICGARRRKKLTIHVKITHRRTPYISHISVRMRVINQIIICHIVWAVSHRIWSLSHTSWVLSHKQVILSLLTATIQTPGIVLLSRKSVSIRHRPSTQSSHKIETKN